MSIDLTGRFNKIFRSSNFLAEDMKRELEKSKEIAQFVWISSIYNNLSFF